MRKILSLLILLNLIISCSGDDSANEQQTSEFPTDITFSSQTAEIGDTLTINGNGFSENETYIITFAENEVAEIIEINSNYLNVEVPENAISGSITLTFDNQTKTIGTIEINELSERVFADNFESKIVEIDINTGKVIKTIVDYGNNRLFKNRFIESSNEIISRGSDGKTYKTDIENGNTSLLTETYYEEFIVDNNKNRVFADNFESKIVEIDINTGKVIKTIVDYGNNRLFKNRFIESSNEIISRGSDGKTYKTDIENGNTSLLTETYYEEFIVDNNKNRVFADDFTNKIVEIDINTGEVIKTIVDYGNNRLFKNRFIESSNEIISRGSDGKTYKTDIENGTTSLLTETYYEEFVVIKK